MSRPYFEAPNPHEAWAKVAEHVLGANEDVHVVTRIADPTVRDHDFERVYDEALEEREIAPVRTVAGTIFPIAWGRRIADPAELAAHYRDNYDTLRGYPKNDKGTYFGRLVELDDQRGEDQFTVVARKLRDAVEGQTLTSRYELNVYDFSRDGIKTRAFPCMSFLSVHLMGGALHMCAHYRNHAAFERLYGNFIGLAAMLDYLANFCGVDVGELLVVSGHIERDAPKKLLTDLIAMARESVEVSA